MENTIYHIAVKKEKKNTAGAKAPDDISNLCDRRGYVRFEMPQMPKNKYYRKMWLAFVCIKYWKKLEKTTKAGDVVIFQHPMYGNRVSEKMIPRIKKKGVKFVVLIHDLESLRKGISGVIKENVKTNEIADNLLLKHFDAIICHNEHMRQYMVSQGFDSNKLINLEIFDYLSDVMPKNKYNEIDNSIIIAGNLAQGKCGYIYDIYSNGMNQKLTTHLFGINYEEKFASTMMKYHGSFKPEELPMYLEGSFGLVWDGITCQTCAGNTGEYLKYNNPHKTSLYLSSGIPVVVWSHAAIADFVQKNNVGICVDSLERLDEVISKISNDEYKEMINNTKEISEKLHNGYYFYTALNKALEIIE